MWNLVKILWDLEFCKDYVFIIFLVEFYFYWESYFGCLKYRLRIFGINIIYVVCCKFYVKDINKSY